MNNAVFGKTMKNVKDIKLVTTEKRRNYLVLEPNYQNTKFFTEYLLSTKIKKKTQIFINKPFYLGLSILEIIKLVMYEFCYGYVKKK